MVPEEADYPALGLEPGATVLLFDADLEAFNHASDQTKTLPLDGDAQLAYLPLSPGQSLKVGQDGFHLLEDE